MSEEYWKAIDAFKLMTTAERLEAYKACDCVLIKATYSMIMFREIK